MRKVRFPQVKPDYFPFKGGLDLLTPAIAMEPGKTISAVNYEPEIGGGYRRIDGFERYDGQDSPSSKNYWIATVNLSSTPEVGDVITGASSGSTAVVLYVIPAEASTATPSTGTFSGFRSFFAPWMGGGTTISQSYLVLGALSASFTNGESIGIGVIHEVILNGASTAEENADYLLLAANLQRANILKVPGSGRIRGVWIYEGTRYAFRDNVAGTAGDMYKATSSGWVKINFGNEIQFTNAVGQINVGDTITGGTSGATAIVVKAMLRSGSWTVSGVGTLIISTITGTWQSGEAIQVSAVTKATSSSLATSITRLPGGRLEFVNDNFTGSTLTRKMYGADGVNLGFEFDGVNYIPIRTGMTTDTPSHVVVHRFYLVFSFRGSVQLSGIGEPYSWTPVLGASEIATGNTVTGFQVQAGAGSAGASLAIFTDGQTFILYGSDLASFNLVPSVYDIGAMAYTSQPIGNDVMVLSKRGLQRFRTTQNYGDFEYASVSHLVQKLMTTKRGLQTASITLRTKNQYRVYFSDGSGLVVGLTGDKISGIMPLYYGKTVRCMCTNEDDDEAEVCYFGSDDGYVYQDSIGTSFDGNVLVSALRMPFNNLKSPRVRKQFHAAILELVVEGFTNLNVSFDLGYGNPDIAQGTSSFDQPLMIGGGYWDQFTWDEFSWDTQSIGNPRISLDGIEKNISLLFYSSRAQDKSHTLQGVTILSTPTRLEG